MDATDAFFTHTVVGAPFSAMLGRRRMPGSDSGEGLSVDLSSGHSALTAAWQDWMVLSHTLDPLGKPRARPGPIRLRLERHALWIAAVGLVSLLLSMVLWATRLWA